MSKKQTNKQKSDIIANNIQDVEIVSEELSAPSKYVKKGWGYEIVMVNNERYCGKILHFNSGSKFSMHYHIKKEETWYVNYGKLVLKWMDTSNAELKENTLNKGDVITIVAGLPHQLIALEESEVFEVSTQHLEEDSYRIWKGDSQIDINS